MDRIKAEGAGIELRKGLLDVGAVDVIQRESNEAGLIFIVNK